MTEDEARSWIVDRFGTEAGLRLASFLDDVMVETTRQNLISPATVPLIWTRHAVDSAQLVPIVGDSWETWIDIGTGGGFPGMVVALLAPDRRVTMVEPRRKRAAFLQQSVERSGLRHASVHASRIELVSDTADIISARAVASIENLLQAAGHCAKDNTTWLLPRGRSGLDDLPLKRSMFHVEHSLTDPASSILVLKGRGR